MRRFRSAAPCLLALGLLCALPKLSEASGKGGMFSRMARTLQNTVSAVSSSVPASSPAAEEDDDDVTFADQKSINVWNEVDAFKLVDRALNNDHYNILSDIFNDPGYDKIFGDPVRTKAILEAAPIFKGFKPLQSLYAKDTLDASDGAVVVDTLRKFIGKLPDTVKELADPDGFADKFVKYLTSDDEVLKELYPKAQAGDLNASRDYIQRVNDLEWGDLIDLDEFGLGAKIPEQIKVMRAAWDKFGGEDLLEMVHQGDPEMKAHIDDPLLAVKQVASATGLDLFNWKTEKRV